MIAKIISLAKFMAGDVEKAITSLVSYEKKLLEKIFFLTDGLDMSSGYQVFIFPNFSEDPLKLQRIEKTGQISSM